MVSDAQRKIESLERSLRRQALSAGTAHRMVCRGGPYHGESLSLYGDYSATIVVNGWRGRYCFTREKVRGGVFRNIAIWENET